MLCDGRGISLNQLFNSDNIVWKTMDFIGKLLLLNLLTLSCCLPVVTMGAAIAANYKVTQNLVLKIDGSLVKTYFRAFRTNFIQATWVWFGELVVIVGVVFNLLYLIPTYYGGTMGIVLTIALTFALLLILGICNMFFPFLVRFENRLITHLQNSIYLVFKNLSRTLLVTIINVLIIALTIIFVIDSPSIVFFWISFFASVVTLINNWLIKDLLISAEVKREKAIE